MVSFFILLYLYVSLLDFNVFVLVCANKIERMNHQIFREV